MNIDVFQLGYYYAANTNLYQASLVDQRILVLQWFSSLGSHT
jgi:hypothetical protein